VGEDEIARSLAEEAATEESNAKLGLTTSVALKNAAKLAPTAKRQQYDIDSALPGKHTRKLYDDRPRREAAILCQLRTDKNRLNGHLAKIGAAQTDRCECRGNPPETTRHFLFECPRWCRQREQLKEVAGDRWGDLSYFVGGRTERRKPTGELLDGERKGWWPDDATIEATIKFAIDTGRLS
jgi:hypothetical protein